ncbi:GNAT family N-acetyltransferase [Paenibacillus odorifer]|uniref:GNAT family N-acetyltransferase n=1 Tax=Paenibacillus odorifer TaxID=189426 RepID=A0A1R0Z887_9BACL|nr:MULTISPECIES: GNAT family N-acetyltransferase [Paenibacillus]KAA1186465.1 GNAT family N-acetyltransferase [Paenibacillus sp. B2(2019)]OMD44842.1 GNAT family N-acetyltransferase [Paenibacillus odorifer]OME64303.1 GNAT family N-acetyltransferase [Paenibacillus odorifer]
MYDICIKEITKNNWEEAFELSVHESQKSFVPNIAESLAFAYIKPWDEALDPYVLYENNRIIGAFYISYTPNSEENYWIGGFQIDKELQGKGYGKQALNKIIEYIKEKHRKCKVISLTVEKENEKAIDLYEKAGFISQNQENTYQQPIYKLKIE